MTSHLSCVFHAQYSRPRVVLELRHNLQQVVLALEALLVMRFHVSLEVALPGRPVGAEDAGEGLHAPVQSHVATQFTLILRQVLAMGALEGT